MSTDRCGLADRLVQDLPAQGQVLPRRGEGRRGAAAAAPGGERPAGGAGLGEREDVGHYAVALEGVPRAGAAQPGLRLVDDQQHAALAALAGQGGEVTRRWLDDAAGAEDRLDDAGREASRRL